MHLTNVAIQQTGAAYNRAHGNKWPLASLRLYLEATRGGEAAARLFEDIEVRPGSVAALVMMMADGSGRCVRRCHTSPPALSAVLPCVCNCGPLTLSDPLLPHPPSLPAAASL